MNNNVSNFNDELMKMLEESYNEPDSNSEKCLISNELLEDNCIKLECNHKFNYKHIYNEVHKQKKNAWHSEVNKVKSVEIKCPYCRNIQKGLLPHREGYPKVKYVNWPISLMMLPDNCIYTFASGKRKGQPCSKKCMGKYCSSHAKIIQKREKKKQEKLEKLDQLKKIKETSKKAKLNTLSVNIIIPNVQINNCSYIFKRGKNKGFNCSCKKIYENNLCKFHSKKYIKKDTKPTPIYNNIVS
jgi:hypothetical protein